MIFQKTLTLCRAGLLTAVFLSLVPADVEAQFGGPGGGRRDGGGFRGPGGGGFDGGRMGGQGGITRVLGWDRLGEELKLSEEQKAAVAQIVEQATPDREAMMGIFSQMREASEEERAQLMTELQAQAKTRQQEVEKSLQNALSAEQFNRLKQISRQQTGTRGLTDEETAQALKLTPEQTTKIEEILNPPNQDRGAIFRMSSEEREKRRQETEQAVLNVLTPEQSTQWKEMLGPPAEGLDSLRGGFGGPGGPGGRRGRDDRRSESGDSFTPGGNPAMAESSSTPSPTPGITPPATGTSTTGAADPLDSFMDFLTQPSTPATPAESVPTGPAVVDFGLSDLAGETAGPDGAQTVTFNFQYAPWEDVLKLFARFAGLTLDMQSPPAGTFTYYDKTEHTPAEALDVLNGYLLQRGYILVRRDQFLIVANISQGIPPNLVPTVEVEDLPSRGKNELVRSVFTLDQIRAADLVNDVKSLLGPQGTVTPMGTTNRLVVTGLARELIRVNNLLTGASLTAGPNEMSFRAFRLEHIPAVDAEPTIKALLGVGASLGGSSGSSSRRGGSSSDDRRAQFMQMMSRMRGGDQRGGGGPPEAMPDSSANSEARVTIDQRTNSLLVAAKLSDLLIVEQAVKQIDLPSKDGVSAFQTATGPSLKVYKIPSGDLGKISETLMAMVPGVMINEDNRADVLHVIGTEAKQREVGELIRLLDGQGGGNEVALVPLFNLDPTWTANALNNMFMNEGTTAPIIQTDQYGQNLVVRGTSDHLLQVKAMVLQMSQTAGGQGSIIGVNSGPIRQIPLSGQDPADLIPLLQRMWSSSHQTPLKVIRPGDAARESSRESSRPAFPREERNPREAPRDSRDEASVRPQQSGFTTIPVNWQGPETQASENPLSEMPSSEIPSSDRPYTEEDSAQSGNSPAQQEPSATSVPEEQAETAGGVTLTIVGDRLIISGQNERELDALQRMLNSLMQQMATQTKWTIFYLRVADASATAQMLQQLFPDIELAASTSSSSVLSRLGQLPAPQSSTIAATAVPPIRIVPEARSNALFVSGPADRVRELEEVIKLLDSSELPETFRERVARTIPVEYASVQDVAQVVSEVYADLLPQPAQNRGRPGEEASAALLAGELTISVDAQTSQIVVSCRESLFRQIEELVQSLDESARVAKRTVRVVNLDYADAAAVQTTLGTLLPKVSFSTSGTTSRVTTSRSTTTQQTNTSGRPWGDSSSSSSDESRRQFFQDMMRRRMEGGGGSPFGGGGMSPFGGGRGGESPFGGGRGGDRGSRSGGRGR